jgi:hypothetical protein
LAISRIRSLAFGGMLIGSNYSSCLCALSHERINDFERIEKPP